MYPQYQQQPPQPESPFTLPLKVLAGSAVLFILSIGFCGVGAFSGSHFQGFFVGAGLLCLGISGVALVVSVLWLIIAAVTSRS